MDEVGDRKFRTKDGATRWNRTGIRRPPGRLQKLLRLHPAVRCRVDPANQMTMVVDVISKQHHRGDVEPDLQLLPLQSLAESLPAQPQ